MLYKVSKCLIRLVFLLFFLTTHSLVADKVTVYETAKLSPLIHSSYGFFGSSVSIYESYAGCGAPFQDLYAMCSGGAYIYTFNGSDWISQAALIDPDAGDGDELGQSISINGDWCAVGANGDESVHLLKYENNSWTLRNHLKASDPGTTDDFGF